MDRSAVQGSRAGARAMLGRLVGCAIVAGLAFLLERGFTQARDTALTPVATVSPASWVERSSNVPVASSPSAAPRPAGRLKAASTSCLQGDALARAWLTGFLTRPDRNDTTWAPRIASLSTPRLLDNLRAGGPEAVGLERLRSWRVGRIDAVAAVDRALDTPTRRVLAYAATVTDGRVAEQKPFVLYSYLDADGCWRVGDIEQPYSSEG